MNLSDFVLAERSVVPLNTTSLREAADILVERLVQDGAVENPIALEDRIAEERAEDIVAMGDRAFLLHYRTDAVHDIVVGLGTSLVPICRELGETEEQCARIVLLIASPPRLASRYLQLVGAFAKALQSRENVEAVLQQPDAESLTRLPLFAQYVLPEQLTVRDIMTENPWTVQPDTSIRDAALYMVRRAVESLPVVDEEGHLIGMLGERELLQHLLGSQVIGSAQKPPPSDGGGRRVVRDIMTRQVLGVAPEQPVAEAAALMSNKDVDRVPVVRDGRLIGLLTRGDIVRKLIGS